MTTHFLSVSEVAARLGVSPAAISSYIRKGLMPTPDATIGKVSGWLPETIEVWNAERPGRGARTDLKGK